MMRHLDPFPPPPDDAVRALAARLNQAAQARLGRSLALLHLPAGGCGGCELELRATTDLLHDLERYGLHFVATPRHADVLLLTGPMTRNLHEALLRTAEATPDPKWIIALGNCAIDGGPFRGSYATGPAPLPIDLAIRGCPPTPAEILDGLRALVSAHAMPG